MHGPDETRNFLVACLSASMILVIAVNSTRLSATQRLRMIASSVPWKASADFSNRKQLCCRLMHKP
jgi:hypothetical protein